MLRPGRPAPDDAVDGMLTDLATRLSHLPVDDLIALGVFRRPDRRLDDGEQTWPTVSRPDARLAIHVTGDRLHRAIAFVSGLDTVVRLWVDGREIAVPADRHGPAVEPVCWDSTGRLCYLDLDAENPPSAGWSRVRSRGVLIHDTVTRRTWSEYPRPDEHWESPCVGVVGGRVYVYGRYGDAPARDRPL